MLFWKSSLSESQVDSTAEGFTLTTTSRPETPASTSCLDAALSLRVSRFLVTALPTFLETMKPNLAGEASSVRRMLTERYFPLTFLPNRRVRLNSAPVRSRLALASTICSGRQFAAALAAASAQDRATGAGAHSRPESVDPRTLAVARLKGSLSHLGVSMSGSLLQVQAR